MEKQGLYDPRFEHDSCGVGFVVNVDGKKSHALITEGITILKNLLHRGAVGGDMKTGDGAGILVQTPHDFFCKVLKKSKVTLPKQDTYGIGMLFMPQDQKKRESIIASINKIISDQKGTLIAYRTVPVDPSCLGKLALDSMPHVEQVFVTFDGLDGVELERKLYVIRKEIENTIYSTGLTIEDFYIPSFSCKTIVYKGLLLGDQFEIFFTDLVDPDFQSAIIVIHQRYSTNTFPSWPLAQPFRYTAHNGEINTLTGNENRMQAREASMQSAYLGEDIKKVIPIIQPELSDSGKLDNVLELLALNGRTIEHSMMMMIPEAFGQKYMISQDKRAFYEFHSTIMEPWDGPAAVVFTDGSKVGCTLDRNGLRPARYIITKTGKVVFASEVGVLDIPAQDVLQKGRLGPGKLLLVDTEEKRIVHDHEVKSRVSRGKPYRRWLEKNRIELKGLFQVPSPVSVDEESLKIRQKIFGYTLEDLYKIILPHAQNAQEPIGSMGNDTPLAVLSEKPQLLFNYFKQLFAQVTNPPIDPYRENIVMSLMSFIGRECNLLEETPLHCHQLMLPQPILTDDDIATLRNAPIPNFDCEQVSLLFPVNEGIDGMIQAVERLCKETEQKIKEGAAILILSDRGVNHEMSSIPSLLAISAVHHHLIKTKQRHLAGLIVETGEAREVMHFATLIGFGASGVNPYLAYETLAELEAKGDLPADMTIEQATENFITAIKKGLLKIMSKMGISTLRSYRGAQIFEAVGLHSSFVNTYFPQTSSRIEGIGMKEIAEETIKRHHQAFTDAHLQEQVLSSGGTYQFRHNEEKHLFSPEAIVALQKAVRTEDYQSFKEYSNLINDRAKNLCTLRGLFKFKEEESISIDEVEPVESIVKRFVSSAMSFGSISKEAHETMAMAMNAIGAASNSGEGGEDEARFKVPTEGASKNSRVKQVASARFGVTSNYLVNCEEIQIKMAQGAKPGEGGQLPGHKVNEIIAKVRHSTPGVMLISPPPHHDIYSIEDLAQLIYDLKNANPKAKVSVKLVSKAGVGTVAAGVAKGKADMVLISGFDGGTGASPISSIQHAGIPWEIGLSETQQTLVLNNLRDRIRIQADGQMKTGRDVVVAALLGADEFGFGTTALVSLGCVMMRKCHLNTCPVGVATQDPALRHRFKGKPEHLINFMRFIAQEVRELMAILGFKKFDDMIGRVDCLEQEESLQWWKLQGLDFSKLLHKVEIDNGSPLHFVKNSDEDFVNAIDPILIEDSKEAIETGTPVTIEQAIRNCNRTVGAALSATISRKCGSTGLQDNTITCKFKGSAGQSFAGFLAKGVTFELEGDANDYLCKGLSGGRVILYPPNRATFLAQNNIITGNVNLFGATSGEVYINGMAGERFAVRNSGATAVVEGVGDHGCEYMTGGTVVILGRTGINFAAGMSGGVAYILDEDQLFDNKCNLEMVDVEPVILQEDRETLLSLITKHSHYTKSEYAMYILKNWTEMLPYFVKVMPIEYKKALERIRMENEKEKEVTILTEEVW